jgi:aspartate oxidase
LAGGGLVDGLEKQGRIVAQRAAAAALERTAELSACGVTLTDSSEDDYDVPAEACSSKERIIMI